MFELFSGPCVLESPGLVREIAGTLKNYFKDEKDIKLVFKGSFDKANRTSVNSFRGPGLDEGLKLLEEVKKEFELPVITDVHLPEQAMAVASVCDYLQIPAFLCRQTDMIIACAQAAKKYNRHLKIKKGQFISPEQTKNIIDKAATILPLKQILLTERGTCFGYNNLIVDMASFQIMKSFGVRTIYDATHSVQRPGGLGDKTGGKREQIIVLAKAAMAAGADGVFMETHPRPDEAKSDAATSLPLSEIKKIITSVYAHYQLEKKGQEQGL